jgi:light-harvesting complex 1 beta chain
VAIAGRHLWTKEVTRQMNDKVPERWRPLFTNEEWLQHQLVVLGSWIFFILAGLIHIIIAMYKPWISPNP